MLARKWATVALVQVACGANDGSDLFSAAAVTGQSDAGEEATPGSPGPSTPRPDASSPTVPGCTTSTFYRDQDGDGYGSPEPVPLCQRTEGWVTRGGDCQDQLKDVSPDAQSFVTTPYDTPNGASFDTNCDGREEAKPGQRRAGNCVLGVSGCTGDGHLPTLQPRAAGTDAHCGSTRGQRCRLTNQGCVAEPTNLAPFSCR